MNQSFAAIKHASFCAELLKNNPSEKAVCHAHNHYIKQTLNLSNTVYQLFINSHNVKLAHLSTSNLSLASNIMKNRNSAIYALRIIKNKMDLIYPKSKHKVDRHVNTVN